MINIKSAKFEMSPQLHNMIEECKHLSFQVLEVGNSGTLVEHIKDLEVTPKDTGFTEEHNEVVSQGTGRKALVNTNEDYGGRIYRNGPDYGRFHNIDHPPYKNAFAREGWLEDDVRPDYPLSEFVVNSIDMELRRKYGLEGDQIKSKMT